ncbi:MAG: NAD-dependent epimerase/dehydratase family protein [Candidatus Hydrogenedentes bacterium]|nr:NAD-dependent epimerase/dehydratase family protein [Candidatus Hydrogenedentota bacterium]
MTVLVTGGGGFLGGAIVSQLLARGENVRSVARGAYPELEARGVTCVRGDLADPEVAAEAVSGCDAVIHVAAKAGVWGPHDDYYRANVTATRNLLEACREQHIGKLVYTSTPSVTFNGEDESGVDESAPYATRFLCHYAATKARAEQDVLAANSPALATVALRPHLIWGPGDNHLVPRLIARAKAGKVKIVGRGGNLVDATYIDNAAAAHLNALDALAPDAPCAGKAYFISNGEPVAMDVLLNQILAAAGLPPITKKVPAGVAYAAGAAMEAVYNLLGKDEEPIMTRFVARQLATAHWFDISAARRDLGYNPAVSMAEGMERLAVWIRNRRECIP